MPEIHASGGKCRQQHHSEINNVKAVDGIFIGYQDEIFSIWVLFETLVSIIFR